MASGIYDKLKTGLMTGLFNLNGSTDTIKVALVNSLYDFDATHNYFSSVASYQVTGTGYTAGGASLGDTKSVTVLDHIIKFDAPDTTWADSTITANGAVIYKDTGDVGTSPLIAYIDFGSDKSSSSGNFTIQWDASGIIVLS